MLANTRRFSPYSVYLTFSFAYWFFATTIFTVNLLYQLEVARFNPLQLVLVGTVLEITCFLCQVPTGVLADLYSRRLSIIVGVLLVGLGFVLEGSLPFFWTIAGAMVFYGVGATFISGAEEAWVVDEIGEVQSGKAFLRGSQAGQIGNILGAILSVVLASLRLNLPILVGGALLVLLGMALFLIMPEHHFHPTLNDVQHSWSGFARTFRQGFRVAWISPMLLLILAASLCFGLASEGYDRLWLAHLQNDIHFPLLWNFQPVVWLGLIAIVGELLTIGVTELVQRHLAAGNQRRLIWMLAGLHIIGMLALLLLAFAGNLALALLALWLVGMFRNVRSPLYATWLTQNSPASIRATLVSLGGQMDAIGQIIGGPPVGYLGTVFSLRVALAAVSALLFPVLGIYLLALRRMRKEDVPGEIVREGQVPFV